MNDTAQRLAEAFVTMLNEHDPDLVDTFVASDYRNHNVFVDDGREANRRFWTGFFTALPDLTATMEDLVVSGDRVVGRFVYRGTHRGEIFGVAPTGKMIAYAGAAFFRIADGKVAEGWVLGYLLSLLRQLGAQKLP